jgi:hypothetical protein
MWIWTRNIAFSPCKFVDLEFADWNTKKISGLIITNSRILYLRTGKPQKFACPPFYLGYSLLCVNHSLIMSIHYQSHRKF